MTTSITIEFQVSLMYHSMNLKTLQKIQNEMTRENAYIYYRLQRRYTGTIEFQVPLTMFY